MEFKVTPETERVIGLAQIYMGADSFEKFSKVARAGATAAQIQAVASANSTTGAPASNSGGDFEALVKAHLAARPGTLKSAAMAAVRKDHPEAYNAWLASQQR